MESYIIIRNHEQTRELTKAHIPHRVLLIHHQIFHPWMAVIGSFQQKHQPQKKMLDKEYRYIYISPTCSIETFACTRFDYRVIDISVYILFYCKDIHIYKLGATTPFLKPADATQRELHSQPKRWGDMSTALQILNFFQHTIYTIIASKDGHYWAS